jgi:hypothetical protein
MYGATGSVTVLCGWLTHSKRASSTVFDTNEIPVWSNGSISALQELQWPCPNTQDRLAAKVTCGATVGTDGATGGTDGATGGTDGADKMIQHIESNQLCPNCITLYV